MTTAVFARTTMTVSMTSTLDVSRPSGDSSSGAWAPRSASPGLPGSPRQRRQEVRGRGCLQGAGGLPSTHDPESGRENNGTVPDDEDGILGDWGRGYCTEYEDVKCALVAEDSMRSMESGTEPRRVLVSPPIDIDVESEEDDDGVLSEDELVAVSSKTGMDVSDRISEATQLRRDNREAGSESSRAEVDAL
ncbi:hypothetical protein BD310DRAFT_904659 [Dichomitus squalens]|uniref:Uncharacterized protein n=1 Tax=Dichomitus squalens TaxID=114155 RepID=A0A4Q9Q3I9_9APHY|nr:hypothetical protein BD310DRAFT_904659 [Dichomitus squalens]